MKIKLGDIQKSLLFKIITDKQALQVKLNDLVQRESELVAVICEAAGVQPVEGMSIEGDELVIPAKREEAIEDATIVG